MQIQALGQVWGQEFAGPVDLGIGVMQDRSIIWDQGGKRNPGFSTVVLSEISGRQQETALSDPNRRESWKK